jgi:hypothetical protein
LLSVVRLSTHRLNDIEVCNTCVHVCVHVCVCSCVRECVRVCV